jgi:tetratricopeptide (TPR) repeat protein
VDFALYQYYIEQERFSEALCLADEAIASGLATSSVWHCKGFAHRLLHEYPQAIVAQEKAVALDPSEPAVLMALGIARQLNGDFEGALAEFRKVRAINPYHAGAYNSAAFTFEKMGNLTKASELYAAALQSLVSSRVFELKNNFEAPYVPASILVGREWLELIMKPTLKLAIEAGAATVRMPTAEMADSQQVARDFGGKYWVDDVGADGKPYRLFLPNFYQTVCLRLRENHEYALYAGNLSNVAQQLQDGVEADKWLAESRAFGR